MKGVILAGGSGSRLRPFTLATNKHLLPVAGKPMIFYALDAMEKAGIKEVQIVVGGDHPGDIIQVVGYFMGWTFDSLSYVYQRRAGGIADALYQAKEFVRGDSCFVLLGDNLFGKSLAWAVSAFRSEREGAQIICAHEVKDNHKFGVPVFKEKLRPTLVVKEIIEKPENPPNSYAVTGAYCYGPEVFKWIGALVPSARGELEITDLNNIYARKNNLSMICVDGWWSDAGTIECLERASELVRTKGANK